MKTKIIPFDLETAKKIQAGEIEGRIVTIEGGAARIVCFDKKTDTRHPLVVLIHDLRDPDIEFVGCYTTKGEVVGDKIYNLCIELPEEAPTTFHVDIPKGHAEIHGDATCFVTKETPKQYPYDIVKEIDCKKSIKHEFKVGDRVLCFGHDDDEVFEIKEIKENHAYLNDGQRMPFDSMILYYRPKNNEFKPFDKVLVKVTDESIWIPRLFSVYYQDAYIMQDGKRYDFCIPYEGNEHLLGTTDKPKEE